MRSGAPLVILAAVLWGTLGVVFQILGDLGATAQAIGFWRAAIAAVALGLGLLAWRPAALRVARRDLPFFVAYGLVSVGIFFAIYPKAVHLSSVAVAVVLLYTAPAWVAVMGALWLREPLTGRKLVALALCFVGIALVAGLHDPGHLNLPGLLAGLASGLTYATLSIFGRAAPEEYEAATLTVWTLGIGALFLALPALRDPEGLLAPWRSPALILYAGIVPTAGSFVLYTAGLRRMGDAGRASLLATVEPVVAAALGLAILREPLSSAQLAGGVLVLLGIAALQLSGRGAPPPRG